jgi:hypothetical protein
VGREGVEGGCAILGLKDLPRAESVKKRLQDAPHIRVVIDNQESEARIFDAEHGARKRFEPTGLYFRLR